MPLDPSAGARFARDFSAVRCRPVGAQGELRSPATPARATIGRTDDPLERDADALASQTLANTAAPSSVASPNSAAPSSMFRNVRIHADKPAWESARALGARAYTVGNDIVFSRGAFAPHTSPGRKLLAHELAHVVQQKDVGSTGGSALVRREPAAPDEFSDDPLSAGGFSDKDASVRVKPGPVRTTLIRPRGTPMTTQDGTPFPGGQPDDGAWIQDFLMFFNLGAIASLGAEDQYAFLSAKAPVRSLSLTGVVDTVIEQGALDGHTLDRNSILGAIGVRLPGPAAPAGPSTNRLSFFVTFSIVRTGHYDSGTGKSSRPDTLAPQAAAQITWEVHAENGSGPEFSWVGQLAAFRDAAGPAEQNTGPFRLQSAYTGFQAGWVFAFLKGSLQIEPIAQALRGVSRAQGAADGIIRLVPTNQIAAGGQIVYVIPKTGDHLQIGGQAAAAFTAPSGARSTIDVAPSVFLQWKF